MDSQIKAVVFDFFGVICSDDFFAWLKEREPDHLVHGGKFFEFLERLDARIASKESFWNAVLADKMAGDVASEFLAVNPRVVRLVHDLKNKRYKTGILSNAPVGWIEGIMARYDLLPMFDSVLGIPRLPQPKPLPEAYDAACNALGLLRHEMLFIDDTDANVLAAERIGIPALHFSDPELLRNDLTSRGILA